MPMFEKGLRELESCMMFVGVIFEFMNGPRCELVESCKEILSIPKLPKDPAGLSLPIPSSCMRGDLLFLKMSPKDLVSLLF